MENCKYFIIYSFRLIIDYYSLIIFLFKFLRFSKYDFRTRNSFVEFSSQALSKTYKLTEAEEYKRFTDFHINCPLIEKNCEN
jgi:hypothetical protein